METQTSTKKETRRSTKTRPIYLQVGEAMATEFTVGIFRFLKSLISGSSVTLAVVYTIGHIFIAVICVRLITGTSLELAAVDALVEPIINGFWFYFLHNMWKRHSV